MNEGCVHLRSTSYRPENSSDDPAVSNSPILHTPHRIPRATSNGTVSETAIRSSPKEGVDTNQWPLQVVKCSESRISTVIASRETRTCRLPQKTSFLRSPQSLQPRLSKIDVNWYFICNGRWLLKIMETKKPVLLLYRSSHGLIHCWVRFPSA